MKSNVYIISVLVALTIHTVTQSMQAPGKEKKTYAMEKRRGANDDALLAASKTGDKAKIISLIESDSNIDTTDVNGMQPLHYAALNGHTATVQLLLERGAIGIDAPNTNDRQPIHLAAQNGDAAMVELLLDRGAIGIDALDKDGRQPIHIASQNGHTATVELLLDREATGIDVPDRDGRQPIHWAAFNGQTATVELLLDRGSTGIDVPDRYGWQPILFASRYGHTATMVTLIAHGGVIPYTMPLHAALPALFAQSDFTTIPSIRFHHICSEKTFTVSDVFAMAAGQNKQETVQTILTRHRTNLTDSNIIDAIIDSGSAGHEAMARMLHDEMSNGSILRSLVPETLARVLSRAVVHRRVDVMSYIIEQDSLYDTPKFSLLRPAGTLLRHILNTYTSAEIDASERLTDYKRILTMLAERQNWRSHTLPLIGRTQAASIGREETVPDVPSPIFSIPTELWLIILNYVAERHLYEIAK